MIKLQIIGHIGSDAIVNDVNGKRVINFNVAHSEKFKDQSGSEINKTTWVQCAYWTDKTSVAQYLLKGTQVFVEGQPDIKQYRANDGSNRANIALRVHSIQLLGSKKDGNEKSGSGEQTNYTSTVSADDITEPIDGLPF